jgi:hypothetical protein
MHFFLHNETVLVNLPKHRQCRPAQPRRVVLGLLVWELVSNRHCRHGIIGWEAISAKWNDVANPMHFFLHNEASQSVSSVTACRIGTGSTFLVRSFFRRRKLAVAVAGASSASAQSILPAFRCRRYSCHATSPQLFRRKVRARQSGVSAVIPVRATHNWHCSYFDICDDKLHVRRQSLGHGYPLLAHAVNLPKPPTQASVISPGVLRLKIVGLGSHHSE